ncbi:MaoC family dehydratase [Aestuariibacter salexigens]|uniref:MaoC family dehydratase n=1 Tax=Aestuariibacter salexigens TaxID=226010 RepID=UPI000408B840|nr:MaoC family dehydratase [Aestuariibacter salexigens]
MKKNLLSLQTGESFEPTDWYTIEQSQINEFAQATGDHQWIHLDKARCEKESPFKTTIAHGFLSVSLMPMMFAKVVDIDEKSYAMLNYGTDKIRFLEPVRSGDRIRFNFKVASRSEKAMGSLFATEAEVEIEGRDKPAMIGTFLMLVIKQ